MSIFVKRLFDYIFVIIIGVIAIPIILITMLVILVVSPEASPLYKQERIGYKCKPFYIYKIRTMTNEKDENGNLLSDEKRITTWGKIIRKLSIDELSQIINILTGQMSWIGPRPILPEQMLVMNEEEQMERQSMLPGITGWEVVNEGKSNSRRQMAEFDLYYVRNWSLLLDLKIFVMTIRKLVIVDRPSDEYRSPELKKDEIRTNKIVGK